MDKNQGGERPRDRLKETQERKKAALPNFSRKGFSVLAGGERKKIGKRKTKKKQKPEGTGGKGAGQAKDLTAGTRIEGEELANFPSKKNQGGEKTSQNLGELL